MLIYKEPLPFDTSDFRKVSLPYQTAKEARNAVLKLDMQYDMPCMWYQADGGQKEGYEYLLLAIGTGHDWGDRLTRDDYIGSLLLMGGTLVLHYFLINIPEGAGGDPDDEVI